MELLSFAGGEPCNRWIMDVRIWFNVGDGKWLLSTGFCRYNLLVILVETCFHGSNICSFSPDGRVWSIFNGVHQRLAYRAFLWGTRISMGQRLSLIIFSIQPSNVWGSLPHFDLNYLHEQWLVGIIISQSASTGKNPVCCVSIVGRNLRG